MPNISDVVAKALVLVQLMRGFLVAKALVTTKLVSFSKDF